MMRNLRILLALVALIAALTFMFSCGNYSGTYISSSPASAQMQQSGGAERSAKLSCEGEIGQRISNLNEYLNGEIGSGNDAVNVQDQRKKYFEFEVQDFPYSDGSGKGILVRIKGRLIGHMEGKKKERPRLKRLLEFVDEAVMKSCIDRISFESSLNTDNYSFPTTI